MLASVPASVPGDGFEEQPEATSRRTKERIPNSYRSQTVRAIQSLSAGTCRGGMRTRAHRFKHFPGSAHGWLGMISDMRRKRSAFVPRAVLGAGFASVVPCIALGSSAFMTQACSMAASAFPYDASKDPYDAKYDAAKDGAADVMEAADVAADVLVDRPDD
jgi:hypothetical protein